MSFLEDTIKEIENMKLESTEDATERIKKELIDEAKEIDGYDEGFEDRVCSRL